MDLNQREAYRPHPHYARYAVDRVTPEGHLGDDVATTEDVKAEANAQLIAAAVNALPGLLDALDVIHELADHVERLEVALRLAQARNRDLESALGRIREASESHPECDRYLGWGDSTTYEVDPATIPDPDAELIEKIGKAIHDADGEFAKDVYRKLARAALDAIREESE